MPTTRPTRLYRHAAARPERQALRRRACAAAAALLCGAAAAADPPLTLRATEALEPVAGAAAQQRAIVLRADRLRLRPDLDAEAQGRVEFRRAGTVIEADRLFYDIAEDLATATGQVRIRTPLGRYSGTALTLKVQRFDGSFQSPSYEFPQLGAGGRAQRVDFIDEAHASAVDARYSSCPRDASADPDWLLQADRVSVDLETNTGRAEGAVLRFLGVPILGAPVLSFPLSDDRKSGWLPPTLVMGSRNGLSVSVPYYWNIAPNRDATFTPVFYSRLGLGLDTELRFLQASDAGRLLWHWLPNDRVANRSRSAWRYEHDGEWSGGTVYQARLLRASDNDYWKDFPASLQSVTPRLLSSTVGIERPLTLRWGEGLAYARVQRWQVLQSTLAADRISAPYQRSPQLGLQFAPRLPSGLRAELETELNRFDLASDSLAGSASATPAATGWRWHGLARLARRFGDSAMWLEPRLHLAAAAYQLDQRAPTQPRNAQRVVPTASVDAGLSFERADSWFGRPQHQLLEPRLLYVRTPYRDQSALPLFDSAERDFNSVSIYAENPFIGSDRVADADMLTAGVSSRWVDDRSGAETLRLGLAQRVRFKPQRVVLDPATGPLNQRLSNLLLDGATSLFEPWHFDAAVEFNPDSSRVERSVLGTRWSPGPYRTLSLGYRLARDLSEQVELGWQWPVWKGSGRPVGAAGGCGGTLYAVGRINHSLRDGRLVDALVGAEYDAGCWIGRVVARRTSTGTNQASTQLMFQIEFTGLSRIGASPLQALKDNIPGYRLLRDPANPMTPTSEQ